MNAALAYETSRSVCPQSEADRLVDSILKRVANAARCGHTSCLVTETSEVVGASAAASARLKQDGYWFTNSLGFTTIHWSRRPWYQGFLDWGD